MISKYEGKRKLERTATSGGIPVGSRCFFRGGIEYIVGCSIKNRMNDGIMWCQYE